MYKDQQKKIKALLGSSNAEVTHALAKITLAWDIPTVRDTLKLLVKLASSFDAPSSGMGILGTFF